jgi:2-polyprenyl-3-methyl-5-hydroxy-6-metoxy-1,4-benzoquinol methylase
MYAVVACGNTIGLKTDSEIIKKEILAFNKNAKIDLINMKDKHIKSNPEKQYLCKFIIESITPSAIFYTQAAYTVFVPNSEFLTEWDDKYVKFVDIILCKNKHIYNIYKSQKVDADLILCKFTTPCLYKSLKKDYTLMTHFAGTSMLKNTGELLNYWINSDFIKSNHKLIITRRLIFKTTLDDLERNIFKKVDFQPITKFLNHTVTGKAYKNIYWFDFLPYQVMSDIANTAGISLCPSLIEGYGHYINESRCLAQVILTTDAAPMNEFILDKTQLVDVNESILMTKAIKREYPAKHVDYLHNIDWLNFDKKLKTITAMTTDNLNKIGSSNRKLYLSDTEYFKKEFNSVIKRVSTPITNEEVFNSIYKQKRWMLTKLATESGDGSSIQATEKAQQIISNVIIKYNIKTMYDAACGDMNWMPRVLEKLPNVKYTGADVASIKIKQHQKNTKLKYTFKHADVTNDKIDKYDLILCRDVLQHIPHIDVFKALLNISKSGSSYLLATNYIKQPEYKSILDILPGFVNLRNLFNKPISIDYTDVCFDEEYDGKYLCLWKLPFSSAFIKHVKSYIKQNS